MEEEDVVTEDELLELVEKYLYQLDQGEELGIEHVERALAEGLIEHAIWNAETLPTVKNFPLDLFELKHQIDYYHGRGELDLEHAGPEQDWEWVSAEQVKAGDKLYLPGSQISERITRIEQEWDRRGPRRYTFKIEGSTLAVKIQGEKVRVLR